MRQNRPVERAQYTGHSACYHWHSRCH